MILSQKSRIDQRTFIIYNNTKKKRILSRKLKLTRQSPFRLPYDKVENYKVEPASLRANKQMHLILDCFRTVFLTEVSYFPNFQTKNTVS